MLFTNTQDGMNTCPLSSVMLDAHVKAVQVSIVNNIKGLLTQGAYVADFFATFSEDTGIISSIWSL
jgi:hypothetical protein